MDQFTEIRDLMFRNQFVEAQSKIDQNVGALTTSPFLNLYNIYISYLKTLDTSCFKNLFGFSDDNREVFFDFFYSFNIRPQDNKAFIDTISSFFSEQTISVYESYSDVHQNNYTKTDYSPELYSDTAYYYILKGDLQKGWINKTLNMGHQIPPFIDPSKFCQPPALKHKTLLITPEQGFGDNIIHFRMWQKFCKKALTVKVVFIVRDELFELFNESNDCKNMRLYRFESDYTLYSQIHFDYFCFDYFAPLYLLLKKNNITNYPKLKTSHIHTDKKIGIFWSTEPRTDSWIRLKNVPLEVFWNQLNLDSLLLDGYKICSLQAVHSEQDLKFLEEKGVKIHGFKDFSETANAIQSCEKIFSIDTGVLHLCQALKKDVTCIFNFYKGYHYDKTNGLYPKIKKKNLCNSIFEYHQQKLNK
jgi:hypothetical protein